MTISFIGTGNMGGALARAAVRAGDPQNVALADYSAEKAKALADELGCRFAADNAAAVRASNYILLAVKPQVMKGVLEGIVPVLAECVKNGERKVLVTIAAGPVSYTHLDVYKRQDLSTMRWSNFRRKSHPVSVLIRQELFGRFRGLIELSFEFNRSHGEYIFLCINSKPLSSLEPHIYGTVNGCSSSSTHSNTCLLYTSNASPSCGKKAYSPRP